MELNFKSSTVNEQTVPDDDVLTKEIIQKNLANLGLTADGNSYAYLNVSLQGFGFTNIDALAYFPLLQKVELAYNQLTDVSPLKLLTNVVYLDISNNCITQLPVFAQPVLSLRHLDASFNDIRIIGDLSCMPCLNKLLLDNNRISELTGLSECKLLSELGLANNLIANIRGIDELLIQVLNLKCNKVEKLQSLVTLTNLRDLNLFNNSVKSLDGLQGHNYLEALDLEKNKIVDIWELEYLKELPLLRKLTLVGNPVQEVPDYRVSCILALPRLLELDRQRATIAEKVEAHNILSPTPAYEASRDHMINVIYQFMRPQRVRQSTLPSLEPPYPMLVLVGPEGCGKKALAMKIAEEFCEYFSYCCQLTTREAYPWEERDRDFSFTSEDRFRYLIKRGEFIVTYLWYGMCWYGLPWASVEHAAREDMACVAQMELKGALSLSYSHFEPRFVLVLPKTLLKLASRLKERSVYPLEVIDQICKGFATYEEHNRENPGFFDCVIQTDDIVDAYAQLKAIVNGYLGLPQSPLPGAATSLVDSTNAGRLKGSGRIWSRFSQREQMTSSERDHPTAAFSHRSSTVETSFMGKIHEDSYQRRRTATKQAIENFVPSLYDDRYQTHRNSPEYYYEPPSSLMQRSLSAPMHFNVQQSPDESFQSAIKTRLPPIAGRPPSSGSSPADSLPDF